jgi:hypothetical protein
MQNPTNDIENKIENREQQSLLCLVLLQALLSLCLVAYAEVLGDRLRPFPEPIVKVAVGISKYRQGLLKLH